MARVKLTAGRIGALKCPQRSAQAFLWDTEAPGLGVRATRDSDIRVYVFQGRLAGAAFRTTIGDVRTWTLDGARTEARAMASAVDKGIDPRVVKAERIAAVAAAKLDAAIASAPALDAWKVYTAAHAAKWSEWHRLDHERVTAEGGKPITRGRKTTADGKTQPGALRVLLSRPLVEIDAERVGQWLEAQAAKRPTHAALAFRLLRGFLNWCSEHPEYATQVDGDACKTKRVRDELPKPRRKADCLQREQLRPWFESVSAISTPAIRAYLQILLLTGARPGEVAALRWDGVDFDWRSLTIRDKAEGARVIPLTPYVAALLRQLKAINETPPALPRKLRKAAADQPRPEWKPSPWVFASARAASGRLVEPRIAHAKALAAAGLPNVTLHGLRRSFSTLSEWVEAPAGVVAQIMGHKPSALVEKHYKTRPLDLLRLWHIKVEDWILEQAGIEAAEYSERAPVLRVVAGNE